MILVTKFLLPFSTLSGTKEDRFQGEELGGVQMAASCGDYQVFLLLHYPIKPKLSYREHNPLLRYPIKPKLSYCECNPPLMPL